MAIGRIPEPLAGVQESLFTTKGDLVVATGPSQVVRQGVGSNNQVLMADSVQADGVKWANEATATLTAKGDILTATGANTIARLGVGANGTTLVADSAEATGLKWAAPSGGGKVLQVVQATTTTSTTIASTTYTDTGLSGSITPSSTSSKILVMTLQTVFYKRNANQLFVAGRLLRGATSVLDLDAYNYIASNAFTSSIPFELYQQFAVTYLDSPSTTSSTTYKTQGRIQTTADSGSSTYQIANATGVMILMEIGA